MVFTPVIYALIAGCSFGMWFVFHKLASGHVAQLFGAVTISFIAVLFGALIWAGRGFQIEDYQFSYKGLLFVILAGVAAFCIDYFSLQAFSKGLSVSIGAPLIVGLSTAIPVLVGILFLGETITIVKALAIGFIALGAILLSAISM